MSTHSIFSQTSIRFFGSLSHLIIKVCNSPLTSGNNLADQNISRLGLRKVSNENIYWNYTAALTLRSITNYNSGFISGTLWTHKCYSRSVSYNKFCLLPVQSPFIMSDQLLKSPNFIHSIISIRCSLL